MTDRKGNILIASLGNSPGVVTSAVDALASKGIAIGKVITISTQGSETCFKDRNGKIQPSQNGYVEILINEFKNYPRYNNIEYIYDCTKHIDIDSRIECEDFLNLARDHIEKYQQDGYDIYVCIAGGRKSMSAILTIAAQLYGFEKIFHIAINDQNERDYIDLYGSKIEFLRGNKKDCILHPGSAEIVELPICKLSSFMKSEPGSMENEENNGLLNTLRRFCEEIQNRLARDVLQNDPTKQE